MSNSAKILSLGYNTAQATIDFAPKNDCLSVRLLKDIGTVNPLQPSYITNVLLCGNCVDPLTRCIYVFYIDTYFGSAWIIEINVDNRVQSVVYYDKYNNIGFDPNHKIYNPKVVFGRLVWTDNVNPIYQMDIKRAKNSFTYKIGYGAFPNTTEWNATSSYSLGQIVSNGNYFYKSLVYNNVGYEPRTDDGTHWGIPPLCMIEDAYYSMNIENFYFEAMPPKHPPVVQYFSDNNRQVNNLRQTLFQIAYRYVYMDWRRSTFSPASILAMPNGEEEVATGLANEMTSLNNALEITLNTGGEEVRQIEVVVRSSSDPSKWFLIDTIDKFSEQENAGAISQNIIAPVLTISFSFPQPDMENGTIVNPGDTGFAFSFPSIGVTNAYISASVNSMQWPDSSYSGTETVLTIVGGTTEGTLVSFPSWITISNVPYHGSMKAGDTIYNAQTLMITPASANTGVLRSGTVVLKDSLGDTIYIAVSQLAPVIPPTLVIEAGSPDLISVSNTSGVATMGSASITVTFTPDDVLYGPKVVFSTPYYIYANGVASGTGTLSDLLNQYSNSRTVTMSRQVASGDYIIVYVGPLV